MAKLKKKPPAVKLSNLEEALAEADKSEGSGNTRLAIFKLVETFASILNRKIWVVSGPNACTDLRQITLPLDSPHAYQLAEHELAHIVFKSNIALKLEFIDQYTIAVQQTMLKYGVTASPEALSTVLNDIVNILEDHRVNSLWGVLYPGSFNRITQMNQGFYWQRTHFATFNLTTYFGCLDVGLEVEAPNFTPYRPPMKEALRMVECRDFDATLAAAKWLVMKLIDAFLEQFKVDPKKSPEVRAQALDRLLNDFRMTPPDVQNRADDVQNRAPPSAEEMAEAEKLAQKLTAMNGEKLVEHIEASGQDAGRMVDTIRQSMLEKCTREAFLRKGTSYRVVFRDVPPIVFAYYTAEEGRRMHGVAKSIVENEPDHPALARATHDLTYIPKTLQFLLEDEATTRRLRSLFYRAIGKKRFQLREEGLEVDPQALVERWIGQQNVACFRQAAQGRGFKTLLLLDRSSSMGQYKTWQVDRACTVLAHALRFPFVDLTIWGFQSLENGQVDILRYGTQFRLMGSQKEDIGGGTPLHIATRLALRHLDVGDDRKHLFILTDGCPAFADRTGRPMTPEALQKSVRSEVRKGRQRGIQVTGVLVGHPLGNEVIYDMSPKEMSFMFGPARHWRFTDPRNLGYDLIQLVTSSFLAYLGSG